jgi:KipI family sensor histidine kinase inhibitor
VIAGTGRRPPFSAFGDAAVVVAVPDPLAAEELAAKARGACLAGVRDVVGGLRSVVAVFDPRVTDTEQVGAALGRLDRHGAPARPAPKAVELGVVFDGPDLAAVGESTGLGVLGVIDELTGTRLEVAALGFSPGFAYLAGLRPPLSAVARRATPRSSVPAGSVAVAGGFAAVYPQATPGGWQLLGRTRARLFDAGRPPFAVLAPGDTVRFVALGQGEDPPPPGDDAGSPTVPKTAPQNAPDATPAVVCFVVERAGFQAWLQDAGRVGVAHLGVPAAGPADPSSHAAANRLVGNPSDAAAVEIIARGPQLRACREVFVAVAGAEAEIRLDGKAVASGRVVPVGRGQRLSVGPVRDGLRAYLAVAGGLVVAPLMGSMSTDTLAGLGPGPLHEGQELGLGDLAGPLADHLVPGHSTADPPAGRSAVRLRVVPGPHSGWFPPDVLDRLAATPFVVEPASDRVGIRLGPLGGGRSLPRRPGELAFQGMVTGAVQVPSDGRPVVLMPDHATVGGYPVVAVVITADLGLLGQCAPGDVVCFSPIDLAGARQALREHDRRLAAALCGRYPAHLA